MSAAGCPNHCHVAIPSGCVLGVSVRAGVWQITDRHSTNKTAKAKAQVRAIFTGTGEVGSFISLLFGMGCKYLRRVKELSQLSLVRW